MRRSVMKKLEYLMEKDKDIVVLTGDLGFSILDDVRKKFPERFFNVGVSEQAMISIAAGLAKEEKKVIVYSIIPFLIYRPFEQILIDVCYHKLPVVLIGSAEGFSYGSEAISHYALNDLSLTLQLQEMRVYAPAEPEEAASFLEEALDLASPAYIRLSKEHSQFKAVSKKNYNGMTLLREAGDIVVLSTGGISVYAERAVEMLKNDGIEVTHIHIGRIKPLATEELNRYMLKANIIISVEEHEKTLGFGKYIQDYSHKKINILGVENVFTRKVGEREYMLKNEMLDESGLYQRIKKIVEEEG